MSVYINNAPKPSISTFFGIQQDVYLALENSPTIHQYDTVRELLFELLLRENIIKAAQLLHGSQVQFEPFKTSRFNPFIWKKTKNGYLLNPNALPSHAINDVFINSREYAFECSTAIVIIFYKAVLDSIPISSFNSLFQGLLVWDWQHDRDLGISSKSGSDFIPGDAVYFYNPEFDRPVWTGENAIYLGGNYYFGHGVGIQTGVGMIGALNTLRKKNAVLSAYLIAQHSRVNMKFLEKIQAGYFFD
jgi:protein-glutamine gamma-glutamyltransferase